VGARGEVGDSGPLGRGRDEKDNGLAMAAKMTDPVMGKKSGGRMKVLWVSDG